MGKARLFEPTTPLEILKARMLDPKERKKILAFSSETAKQTHIERMFTGFPLLISQYELDINTDNLIDLMNNVSINSMETDNSMRKLFLVDKIQLKNIVMRIAILGCQSLLKDSKPHPELIKLLGWEQCESRIDITNMICDFTAETFLEILRKANSKMYTDMDVTVASAVTNFLNQHYRVWVIEAIKQTGHHYALDEPKHNNTAGIAAMATFAGFVLLGGVAAAAIMADKSYSPSPQRKR